MEISSKMPLFSSQKERFEWLISNKSTLIQTKKDAIKHSDCVCIQLPVTKDAVISKELTENAQKKDEITVTAVINTTNLMDSHGDVHIPGIWDKSLKENPRLVHLQEHKMEFDKIIADGDDINSYTKTFKWSELGFNYKGTTQALIFESTVKSSRNPFMFKQYSNNYVKNHSVAMIYIDLELAINDSDYKGEYETWQKYIDLIANKEYAESQGYFWAVTEAKVVEGSAVPIGSNFATPTLNVKDLTVLAALETAKKTSELEVPILTGKIEGKEIDEEIKLQKRQFNQDFITVIKLKYNLE